MIQTHWHLNGSLTREARAITSNNELSVFDDWQANCYHVVRSGSEFTSMKMPWDERARDQLRKMSYIVHNGLSESERKACDDENNKLDEDYEKQKDDCFREITDNVMKYAYYKRHSVIAPGGGEAK